MADGRGVSVLAPIGGVPMLVLAVRSVLAAGVVDRVLVDVPESARDVTLACAGLPVDLAQARRRAGAYPGQRAEDGCAAAASDVVLRHDARRPLTPSGLVAAVVATVRAGHAAAVAVLPLTDTVKLVDAAGFVRAAPDRDGLRVVQSPRAWRAGLADPDAVEAHAVPGDPRARSIRTMWDLELAQLSFAALR